jgi:hypothetical protein
MRHFMAMVLLWGLDIYRLHQPRETIVAPYAAGGKGRYLARKGFADTIYIRSAVAR